MPRYSYKAVSMTGENVSGEYNMPDEDGVRAMLRQNGYYPLNIKLIKRDSDRVTKKKIKLKNVAAFCSQISAMLKAGGPSLKRSKYFRSKTTTKNSALF
jgi:type IV pilus assembly protein PilC